MATMIPDVPEETIEHGSERDVYVALKKQLPSSYLVLHSYPWLRMWRGDRSALLEGESDFVVLHPDRGVLVLEVKGGDVDYAHGGTWHRRLADGSKKGIKDPFEQARRNLHALTDIILENSQASTRGSGELRRTAYTHGYAVVFPHVHYRGTPPSNADRAIILSRPDLGAMQAGIERALDAWTAEPRRLDTSRWKTLVDAVLPRFQFIRTLGPDLDAAVERIQQLTDTQAQVFLSLLRPRPRALVLGPAGSGKTLLALERAKAFAEEGKRTLFLCFNRELAEYLIERVTAGDSDWPGTLEIWSFHQLCAHVARAAGVSFEPLDVMSQAFWDREASEILSQAVGLLEEDDSWQRYEAAVVDEGQDFLPGWWDVLLEDLLEEIDTDLHVFMDPNQSLWGKPEIPDLSFPEPMRLDMNCRNTQRVATASGNILGVTTAPYRHAPVGIWPQVVRAKSRVEHAGLAKNAVRRLLTDLAPRQIALLGPASHGRGSLRSILELDGTPIVTSARDWRAGQGLLVTTARSFKGLEADAIVVYDLDGLSRTFSREDLYVACTRARYQLTLIVSSQELRAEIAAWCRFE